MTPLEELLSRRDHVSSAELLHQLKAGLGRTPSASGPGAEIHKQLLAYFKLDDHASSHNFGKAFAKYPQTIEDLLQLCAANGLTTLHRLIQSVMQGRAEPDGRFKHALLNQANESKADRPGVAAAIKGFASVAFANPDSEAEIELSLAWGALEDCLLDAMTPHADTIDFQWGPAEQQKRQLAQAVQAALSAQTAAQILKAFFADPTPTVLAQPSEWDIDNEGAPAETVPITVHHFGPNETLPATWVGRLARYSSAGQLAALYHELNGAALFCVDPHDLWSAGFVFLPAQQWEEAMSEVVDWLTSVDFQDDPESLPAWVRSAIPFGKIPGDASYWLLPVEGPFAGHVLLSNDDVSDGTSRYPNFDTFVATLRLQPHDILGCGGYVSYPGKNDAHLLYPVGYRQ